MCGIKTLIVNGKYFVPVVKNSATIKELIRKIAAKGAGRPIGKDGLPPGPWTPDTLAEAISQIEINKRGIELRTVQLWFQENQKGISSENIRWLAIIFGCNDPDRIMEWQSELAAAQARLKTYRKRAIDHSKAGSMSASNNNCGVQIPLQKLNSENFHLQRPNEISFAEKCEKLLSNPSALHLLTFIWAFYVVNVILNYFAGLHSVTYNPAPGIIKQVGFIWAPTWTLLPLVVLPLFITFVGEILPYWRNNRRNIFHTKNLRLQPENIKSTWSNRLSHYSFTFWVVTFVCIVFVFFAQWFGLFLKVYVTGEIDAFNVDRNSIAVFRPNYISISESLVVSISGYLFTAVYIWVLLVGILLLHIVSVDFATSCKSMVAPVSPNCIDQIDAEAMK